MDSNIIYVPLGLDCSVAYQLKNLGLRYCSFPFDWIYLPKILDLINIIKTDFNNFLNLDMYNIVKLNMTNFKLYDPTNQTISTDSTYLFANYKLVHKQYKLTLPHEINNLKTDLDDFINRYQRRIIRFNQLKKSDKNIVFIRLGSKSDKTYINLLDELLKTNFGMNTRLIFIDSTKYQTSSWHRNEINWQELLNIPT